MGEWLDGAQQRTWLTVAELLPRTPTVARLEDRGLVRRERATEDARGNLAVLTDAGWDVVRAAAPGHAAAVRNAMFESLTAEQTRVLGEALDAVLDRLDPDRSLRVDYAAEETSAG